VKEIMQADASSCVLLSKVMEIDPVDQPYVIVEPQTIIRQPYHSHCV
jgi:hypothetical protein